MTNIKDKPGGRPAKKRIEKQQRVCLLYTSDAADEL